VTLLAGSGWQQRQDACDAASMSEDPVSCTYAAVPQAGSAAIPHISRAMRKRRMR